MGRITPSFRIPSMQEENQWKPFRNALDKSDRNKQLANLTEQVKGMID
jgi:hypothetical protein